MMAEQMVVLKVSQMVILMAVMMAVMKVA